MDKMVLTHNSTKHSRNSDQGRRDEIADRINDTPISINVPSEPKSLVSVKSKGPNTDGNIAYSPDPDDQFMGKDDTDDIPSVLDSLQQNGRIRVTFEEVRDGAGRVIKRNRWD